MARSRSRTAARPKPAPAPAPPSRSFTSSAPIQQAPPPPATPQYAPPPAQPQGGGMMGGIMGNIATGMALGTGSAIAHRAVDSAWNAFSGASQPAEYHSAAQQIAQNEGPCAQQAKQFSDCMSQNNGDMAACQFWFDAMQQCRMGGQ